MPGPPEPARPPHHGRAYRRRDPESTVLYQVVRENLETFLVRQRRRDRPVPRFVERELRGFLECGILAHGFVRVHCDACGHDRLVAFSCKGRGFCSSCGGRRMADTAAWLVDRVLPQVPVRQWVLTLPFPVRYRMAYDARLTSDVLRVFLRAVFSSLKRRARRDTPIRRPQGGAVTFVQRFGDALNLNVHFHALLLDGVYETHPGGTGTFRPLPPPDREELERVLRRIARRLEVILKRHGLDEDLLAQDQPLLAGLAGASIRGRVATGERAGQGVMRLGDRIDAEDLDETPRADCVAGGGFSLHAGVAVPARDRKRLERLCRYVGRPPVATQRLSRLVDGRLLYRLKRRWRDGTTHMIFRPLELIEKLIPLIPPPRAHQVRYHGVLAPCAGRRPDVIPEPGPRGRTPDALSGPIFPAGDPSRNPTPRAPLPPGTPKTPASSAPRAGTADSALPGPETVPRTGPPAHPGTPRRLSWAELMRRVFALDVLECPACHGRMRILAAIHDPEPVRAILDCLGLPSRAPPNEPALLDPDPHGDD